MSGFAARSTTGVKRPKESTVKPKAHGPIAIVEQRTLFRDCLVRCLQQVEATDIVGYPDAAVCVGESAALPPSLIVLSASGCSSEAELRRELRQLSGLTADCPVIVVSDGVELDTVSTILGLGTRGYIPTDHSLEIAVGAMRFVRAGGVYVPASILKKFENHLTKLGKEPQMAYAGYFTPRQAAVVEAIRRGKPNKIIAYELKMCESTVKVHVRTIMKKLKAKNRTEVAFLANSILNGRDVSTVTPKGQELTVLRNTKLTQTGRSAEAGEQSVANGAGDDGSEAESAATIGITVP